MLGRSALPNPGDVIGAKYAITRVLGSGGMGVVFEAMHLRLRQRVAVKMLRPDLAMLGETVARFEREARAAAKLRTRYVVRVLDVDSLDDGTPYMVMEFLEGRDLSAEIAARGTLPIGEAVDYLLQACDAMGEAHRQGTVHRDLKPSNLFLATGERGRVVKVLDFGISKVVEEGVAESVTSTFSVMGTALYMSPELVRSAKHVDARSDVWALAVILYEMLAGRSPFIGETATAIAAAIVADTPTPMRAYRQDVPSLLEAAIMQGLEKDRDRRFADAAAFAAAIAPFASRPGAEPSLSSDAARSPGPPPLLQTTPAVQPARATITAWSRGGPRSTRVPRRMFAIAFALASGAIATAVLMLWPSGSTSPQPASLPSSYSDFSTPAPSVSSPTAIGMGQARGSRVEASSSAEPPSLESPATPNAPTVIPAKRPTPTTSVPPTPARSPKSAPKPPALPAKKSATDLPTDPG